MLFALYRQETALPVAVAERFCWPAALVPPLHALMQGHWGQLALSILGLIGIVVALPFIGELAGGALYGLLAVSSGFAASGAARRACTRRGMRPLDYCLAADPDRARLAVLEQDTKIPESISYEKPFDNKEVAPR